MTTEVRLLRLREVAARTGKSRTTLYTDIRAGTFPKPIKTGRRSVAFVEAEIEAWMAERMANHRTRNGGDGGGE